VPASDLAKCLELLQSATQIDAGVPRDSTMLSDDHEASAGLVDYPSDEDASDDDANDNDDDRKSDAGEQRDENHGALSPQGVTNYPHIDVFTKKILKFRMGFYD
jgi:hypothetical protein